MAHAIDFAVDKLSGIFDSVIPAAVKGSVLWTYGPVGKYRARPTWHEILPCRLALQDLLQASSGHMLHKKCFAATLCRWATQRDYQITMGGAERATWKIRTMLLQLRDAQKKLQDRADTVPGPDQKHL